MIMFSADEAGVCAPKLANSHMIWND